MKRAGSISATIILWAGAASADTAGELYNRCQSVEPTFQGEQLTDDQYAGAMLCMGYVNATVDHLRLQRAISGVNCPKLPESFDYQQAIRVITRFLEQHLEQHHQLAASVSVAALINAFPCTQ